jgi:two-component system chemotaxis response regulator CheY
MAKTLLIVDDSTSLRTTLRLALTRAGYDVLEAADGVEALAVLGKAPKVHLIVCDLDMPHMDGLAFVAQIDQHPRHRFIPVVMLTTEGEEDARRRDSLAQAKTWITKPIHPPQLLDTVSRLLLG